MDLAKIDKFVDKFFKSLLKLPFFLRDFSCQAFDTLEIPHSQDGPQETSFHTIDTKSVKSAKSGVRIRLNGTMDQPEHLVR